MNKVISREYVEKNYVHKNKIKEKIKELEENRQFEMIDFTTGKINILKELLK